MYGQCPGVESACERGLPDTRNEASETASAGCPVWPSLSQLRWLPLPFAGLCIHVPPFILDLLLGAEQDIDIEGRVAGVRPLGPTKMFVGGKSPRTGDAGVDGRPSIGLATSLFAVQTSDFPRLFDRRRTRRRRLKRLLLAIF
jgi:hypothetical protein